MKLSYNKVFDRYTMSFSDKLAESSYSLYRTLRLQLAKIFPLSEHEKYRFDDLVLIFPYLFVICQPLFF